MNTVVEGPDPDEVRAFMVHQRMREPGDQSEVTPPEVRFYLAYWPSWQARQELEAERKREQAEQWAKAQASSARAYEHAEHMRKARQWGRDNGHFVGTRGAIPAAVRQAYQRETGYQL